jgi:magnesium chelatase family protein
VQKARAIQQQRFRAAKTNSEMGLTEIKEFCHLDEAGETVLKQAMKQYNFSGRSLHRILKVARTIADLCGQENILPGNIAEAVQYRPKTE